MRFACAAFVAATLLLGAHAGAQPSSTLTLEDAFERVLKSHPELARFQYQREVLDAELEDAQRAPPLTVGAQLENAPGTGTASGFDRAELTLSLASIVERGGKRGARTAFAQVRVDGLALSEQARRLDLLAEVARRYLDVLAAQTLLSIVVDNVGQRERTVEAAAQRARVGASPDSVRLAAVAAAARARQERERVRAELQGATRRLASLWGDRALAFDRVKGDLLAPPTVTSFEAITAFLERSPELRRFADEKRLREARLQLARASRTADLEWQIGVRRLEDTQDWAAVASLSMPFGTRARSAPAIRAAQAELTELDLERDAEELTLYATLSEAHSRLSAMTIDVTLAAQEVLPALEQAETAAGRAYRAGALSYLEWAQLQVDRTEARREQVSAALQAHRALIEIQRLTGESFVATPLAQQPAKVRP